MQCAPWHNVSIIEISAQHRPSTVTDLEAVSFPVWIKSKYRSESLKKENCAHHWLTLCGPSVFLSCCQCCVSSSDFYDAIHLTAMFISGTCAYTFSLSKSALWIARSSGENRLNPYNCRMNMDVNASKASMWPWIIKYSHSKITESFKWRPCSGSPSVQTADLGRV